MNYEKEVLLLLYALVAWVATNRTRAIDKWIEAEDSPCRKSNVWAFFGVCELIITALVIPFCWVRFWVIVYVM